MASPAPGLCDDPLGVGQLRPSHELPLAGGGGGLNNRTLFSHSPGGWRSEMKVLAGLVSSEASLRGVQLVVFSKRSPGLSVSVS